MILQQEIKKTLQIDGKRNIENSILPNLTQNIYLLTGELFDSLTTLDFDDKKQSERAFNRIYTDLISQTIRQLIEIQNKEKDKIILKKS